jgi:hypothetical protein
MAPRQRNDEAHAPISTMLGTWAVSVNRPQDTAGPPVAGRCRDHCAETARRTG